MVVNYPSLRSEFHMYTEQAVEKHSPAGEHSDIAINQFHIEKCKVSGE